MTVQELIEELNTYDPSAEVFVVASGQKYGFSSDDVYHNTCDPHQVLIDFY